jgi:hypothetical protein
MNRTATRHAAATLLMIGATLAAAFSAAQVQAGDRTVRVATLPTVEIVARREVVLAPRVAQLPLVTVTGKRPVAEAPTRVAQKPAAPAARS